MAKKNDSTKVLSYESHDHYNPCWARLPPSNYVPFFTFEVDLRNKGELPHHGMTWWRSNTRLSCFDLALTDWSSSRAWHNFYAATESRVCPNPNPRFYGATLPLFTLSSVCTATN